MMRKKKWFFLTKYFILPSLPLHPKKKSTKKRVYPLLIRILFFPHCHDLFYFWFKKEWYETVAMGLLFVFCSV